MAIQLSTAAEAFAAIASLVVGADASGSLAERDYLFDQVKGLSVFDGLGPEEYGALLSDVTGRIADELPSDGVTVTGEGVDELARAARDVLTPERRLQALGMARSLAGVDAAGAQEHEVLERLRVGLEA